MGKPPAVQTSRGDPDREPRRQYAALAWRRTEARIEVLLITSRESRRWIIPKGWPIKGKRSHAAAAREAFEEAGVSGKVAKAPLGAYHYDKRLKSGRLQHVLVSVFALEVTAETDHFPEQAEREKAWFDPAGAAERVEEPELKDLIARLPDLLR